MPRIPSADARSSPPARRAQKPRKRKPRRSKPGEPLTIGAPFRTVVERSLAGVYIIQDGKLVYANRALAETFGYDPSEVVGQDPLFVIHPEDRARVAENIQRRLRGEIEVRHYTFRGIRKNGEVNHIEVLGTRMELNGRPAIVGNILDVTDRTRAETALEESEARFRTLIERAPMAIGISRDGVTKYTNRKFLELFGFQSPDELVGHSLGEQWSPESREEILERARLRSRGVPVPSEYEATGLRKDGSQFPVHVNVTTVELPDGRNSVGFLTDITERKRSEQRIEFLNRTHAVLSSINHEIMRQKDSQAMLENACRLAVEKGRFRMAWVGMLDETGTRLGRVASAGVVDGYLDTISIEVRDTAYAAGPTSRCVASGDHAVCNDIAEDPAFAPWRDEALRRGYRSSGSFPLKVDGRTAGAFNMYAAEPHFFDHDEIALLDSLALDIGFALEVDKREKDRRRIEQALGESEEQLRQVQKLEAIGQLAGGVAHDFNNILAAIMMQSDLASIMPGLSDEVREMFGEIKLASERAAGLTRQLLAFSRRQVMQPRVLNVNDEVTNLTRMLGRMIGEDVQLELRLHPSPLVIRADPGMIDQLLLNLAVNARDAMPSGGRLVIETADTKVGTEPARLHATVAPGHYVTLRVSDSGSGIPPDVLPKIFEPFFTTKGPGKGTGLGLATVFGIVKQHAGSIAVRSQPGEGTTFEILLPTAIPGDESAADAPLNLAAAGGSESILVVEDDTHVRKLTRVVLEEAGYKVFEARNGVEALGTWERHRDEIRLLLTDIVLPDALSGRDLASRIRERNPGLKIVYTSGFSADLAGREVAMEEGQTFVQKPYEANLILATVRHCLDS